MRSFLKTGEKMKQKAELLAPAGSMESFYAAVNSGADSVYLGGKMFNARYNSQNFNNEEIKHIISYAHNKNVKIYVTLNTVLKDTEIVDALNNALFLYENDADAVIVQDLGLLYLIKKFISDMPVNISTQASVYNQYGVNFFKSFHVSKIIMAREMSLKQLKEVVECTSTALEVFIHGALCACYSGQCYMSSFLGGRSGNRGKCAQPCRLNYSFYDNEKNQLTENFKNFPVLSMKDLLTGETVRDLIDAGITAFKIEGRMKGPEYTSAAVEYYRQIIDDYYAEKNTQCEELKKRAISTFSRGCTNSYLKPSQDDEMFAGTSSGVQGKDMKHVQKETRKKIQEFSQFRRNKLSFVITLKAGEQAVLKASDSKNTIVVRSEEPCETSIKNLVTEEMIREQLGKLGNTIFELEELNILKEEKEENVFIKKSTLNRLRRDAVRLLYEKGSICYNRPELKKITGKEVFSCNEIRKCIKPQLSLKINNENEVYLVDKLKVKRLYVPCDFDMELVKSINVGEKYLYLPNIVSEAQYGDFKKNMKLYEEIFDGVMVNNVGSFYFFRKNSRLKLHCGPFFNIVNSLSVKLLEEQGAEGFTFSVEANIKDMKSIMTHSSIKAEIVAHEYVQMMVMKNCPVSLIKGCKGHENCDTCKNRYKYALNDRKGAFFHMERKRGLTYIYNSVPLSILRRAEDFASLNIEYFLIDTKWVNNPREVIDALYREINGIETLNILKENSFTRGHYFKNTL